MKLFLFTKDIERIESVKNYIEANLEKDLSIDVLAYTFHVGKSTLRRHFAIYYQKTIHSYILERRMEKAMELLTAEESPIKQVWKQIGYKTRTSFTHAFSKYYGHAPVYYLKYETRAELAH